MAAPMESMQSFRIRVWGIPDPMKDQEKSYWTLIRPDKTKTIGELKQQLAERYRWLAADSRLQLDGSILPDYEDATILRDGESVRITINHTENLVDGQERLADVQGFIDTKRAVPHTVTKHTSGDESTGTIVHGKRKRRKDQVRESDVDEPKKKKKKKKHKHHRADDDDDVLSHVVKQEVESKSVKKKHKKTSNVKEHSKQDNTAEVVDTSKQDLVCQQRTPGVNKDKTSKEAHKGKSKVTTETAGKSPLYSHEKGSDLAATGSKTVDGHQKCSAHTTESESHISSVGKSSRSSETTLNSKQMVNNNEGQSHPNIEKNNTDDGETGNVEQVKRKRKRKRTRKRKSQQLDGTTPPDTSVNSSFDKQGYTSKSTSGKYSMWDVPDVKPSNNTGHVFFDTEEEEEVSYKLASPTVVHVNEEGASFGQVRDSRNKGQKVNGEESESLSVDIQSHKGYTGSKASQACHGVRYDKKQLNKWKHAGTPQGCSLMTEVQVFQRRRQKQSFLSKEAQLATVNTNKSVVLECPSYQDKTGPSNISADSVECVSQVNDEGYNEEEQEDSLQQRENYGGKVPDVKPIDYTQCQLLQGPPVAGDQIVYKVLEMSADYTPEVSDYKRAVVLGYSSVSGLVSMKLQDPKDVLQREGKFDLVVEDEDHILTNCDNAELEVSLPWTSLLEPRLVTE